MRLRRCCCAALTGNDSHRRLAVVGSLLMCSDLNFRSSCPPYGGFVLVRPAWARSWRCKSSRELTTANEVKRNCARVTERGKEAWSEAVSRWTRTGYKALPSRASGHDTAKLSWSRFRWRKSGGCAVKDRVLTWGDLALCLKGRR
jgi:hypothetical protein